MVERVALIGGTGNEGRGIAARLALAGYEVILGSRDAGRASAAAAELAAMVAPHGPDARIRGATNEQAAGDADLVILTVPFEAHRATLEALAPVLRGKLVVDAVVPLRIDRGPRLIDLPEGSATEQAAAVLSGSRVVGGFHTVSAAALLDLGSPLAQDVLLTGDDAEAKAEVGVLVSAIGGRPIDAGRLRYSRFVEGLTVLLIGINGRYHAHAGIHIAGLPG